MSAVRVARVHDPAATRSGRRFLVDRLWPPAAAPDAVRPLLDAARAGDVTLLDAARDAEHNNAVVLREHLLATLGDR